MTRSRSEDLEDAWRALASPIRRRMLDLLRDGPLPTHAIAAEFANLSRFAVMQHLRVLEIADLVVPVRRGRVRLNYLNPVPIQHIYSRWVSRYQESWTEALVSLKGTLEAGVPSPRKRLG